MMDYEYTIDNQFGLARFTHLVVTQEQLTKILKIITPKEKRKLYQWVIHNGNLIFSTSYYYETKADVEKDYSTNPSAKVIKRLDYTMIEVD